MSAHQKTKKLRLQPLKSEVGRVLTFLVLFAILGVAVTILTRATGFSISTEPEVGNLSNSQVSIVSDVTASGGRSIRFGSGSNIQCMMGSSYLWAHLAACGWPDASNTGPIITQCGNNLANDSGDASRIITLSSNSTYSCKNLTGCLYVKGTNVVINNVKITCDMGLKGTAANGKGAIYIENGASATINNVEINASKGEHACVWHQGVSMNITALNCYNANDGVFSWSDTSYSQTTGDNFIIKDSYFHDFTKTTSNGHIDGYQTEGAGNGLIDHSTFYMTSDDSNFTDSAIAIWNSLRSSHDITVQNNLFAGGGNTIYAEDYSPSESNNSGGYSVTNIIFKNNSFSTVFNSCIGFGPGWDGAVWFRVGPSDGWHRTGNKVLETGEDIDGGNPHSSSGSQCS